MSVRGFTVRAPREDEFDAIVGLLTVSEAADLDDPEPPESIAVDLRAEWDRAALDLGHDAWVAVAEDGEPVGYAHVLLRSPETAFIAPTQGVHPGWRGRGVGSALVASAESRARELTVGGGRIRAVVSGDVPDAHRLFADRGYEVASRSWRLEIVLAEPPPRPEWPAMITARGYEYGADDDRLFELVRDAFSDNEGYEWTATRDEWVGYMLPADVSAVVAESGGEIVAAAICPSYPDTGWIRQFAVRRDHRRRGVGRALLLQAFGELYARGLRKVGLGVDSWNTTGARALYESCGMRETLQHDVYEKQLA